MKKKYIAPMTTAYRVELAGMIATSTFDETKDTNSISFSNEETDVFTSRRGTAWDDEDDY